MECPRIERPKQKLPYGSNNTDTDPGIEQGNPWQRLLQLYACTQWASDCISDPVVLISCAGCCRSSFLFTGQIYQHNGHEFIKMYMKEGVNFHICTRDDGMAASAV